MISVDRLALRDFRSYEELDLSFAPGLTAVVGENGNGKTNLIEAIGFISRLQSFRGSPNEAMVRNGQEQAIIRADVTCGDRAVLIEAELPRQGRLRVQVNKQRLGRRGDLAEVLTTTVFSPDDLEIVKGGPGGRRDYLDDLLVDLHPKNDAACTDLAKALKQRNALLKQMSGRLSPESELTLDVWDQRFAELGERVGSLRAKLLEQLVPLVTEAYAVLSLSGTSGSAGTIGMTYSSAWRDGGLAAALAASRSDDVRRGVSTVGPHRDDVELAIDGLPARTHASQGEQRSMVLAMRLAAHRLVTQARGEAPVLLLDDVFSELDPKRSAALLECLPPGQKILTTAAALPPGAVADAVVSIADSRATLG
ncbi:MAG: DNA replication/repair protein RecF [Acidimicrobiales bacterium]